MPKRGNRSALFRGGWASCVATAAPLAAAAKVDDEAERTDKQPTWDDFRGRSINGQQVAWIVATIVLDPVRVEMTDGTGGGAVARFRNRVCTR